MNVESLRQQYWDKRMSLRQIAKVEEVNPNRVRRAMVKFGIERRPFSTKGLQVRLGAVLSEETKKKIGDAHRGRKLSPEHRAKVIKTLFLFRRGESNPSWKGGFITTDSGYIKVKKRDHPRADKGGYVGLHILILEQKLGRYLEPDEICHHKNKIRWDNNPENLELMTSSGHSSFHKTEYWKNKAQQQRKGD